MEQDEVPQEIMINNFSKIQLNEIEQEIEQDEDEDSFRDVPLEIMINIFSMVPANDVLMSKCVCKLWRSLVDTPEFLLYHTPVPCLAVYQWKSSSDLKSGLKSYKVYGFANEFDPEYSTRHCNKAFSFSFFNQKAIHSSANGLLFLCDDHEELFICNPITRDYIELPKLEGVRQRPLNNTFGFGLSRMTGQYKLVWICREAEPLHETSCRVYTLGTGSWRSIESAGQIRFAYNVRGAFLNGNLHWLVNDSNHSLSISCLDLETEVFSKLSPPPVLTRFHDNMTLSALGDCLCLCDNSLKSKISIWMMSTYGEWTKKIVIAQNRPPCYLCVPLFPIKFFEDGDVLIASDGWSRLLRYSNKTGTIKDTEEIDLQFRGSDFRTTAVIYTPTLHPLTTFTMEKVLSF